MVELIFYNYKEIAERVFLKSISNIIIKTHTTKCASFWTSKYDHQDKHKPKWCAIRESNPGLVLGKHQCYHYTNGATLPEDNNPDRFTITIKQALPQCKAVATSNSSLIS